MFPTLDATWIGAAGENAPWGQCHLGGYLYVALWINPGQVKKIDPATMTTVATWTGAVNQVGGRPLGTDGTYIYVGVTSGAMWDSPSRVVKINPATMTTVGEWVGEVIGWHDQSNPEAIIYDAPYIYVTININGGVARVVKIDPVTMTTVSVWDGVGIQYSAKGLTIFGNHLYVPCSDVPARIVKVDKATMATVSEWVGDISDGGYIEGLIWGVTNDGTYLYGATYDYGESAPLRLIKIDVATMTTIDKYIGDAQEWLAYSCIYDSFNNHIFIGTYGYPNDVIIRVDPSTMTRVDRWVSAGSYHALWGFSISTYPKYLFASLWTSGSVLKFSLTSPPPPPSAGGGSGALAGLGKILMG